ncbi:MAG: hypothetical protein DLM52_00560 [Chthoniobacterales bacterium]|nr:MAG: hypothetical protein DLM52_00560 [Chthoniobacterales bacterium]
MRLFPYQHLATASLICDEKAETLRLTFSSHDIQIIGNNLRSLFFALQEFAVKWVRPIPERYLAFETGDDGVILEVRIEETEE